MDSVARWMTRRAVTIDPDAAALEALDLMVKGDFRHLPVVECGGKLVGVLSLDDLRAALPFRVEPGKAPRSSEDRYAALERTVGGLMTFAPLTVIPDEPLPGAARKMATRGIGCLPVVDRQGTLLGILTETDALRALIELAEAGDEAAAAPDDGRVEALEHVARNLRLERAGILRQLGRFQEAERALAEAQRGDPMDLGTHSASAASVLLTGVLAERALFRMAEIDVALARHRVGQLGICVECEEPIPLCRLRALPGTARCRACAAASSVDAAWSRQNHAREREHA